MTFEAETILDSSPLITNLLEFLRLHSDNSASPQTVLAHQPAIQLSVNQLLRGTERKCAFGDIPPT